jgi:hypothetical protein
MIECIPGEEIIEKVDDHFTISEVKPEGVRLSGLMHRGKFRVKLSDEIIDKWNDGWDATLVLSRKMDGWHITGVGNVYPL